VTRTTPRSQRAALAPVDRAALTDELLDELTAWTPRDRLRMLGTWHNSGLSLAHLNVVTLLEMHGPMSMGRVAELLGVSLASTTGIVGRMEERRLVERRASPSDRRVVEVHVGDGGRDLLESIKGRRREHLREVFGRMDERKLAALLEGLRAMRAARASFERECALAEPPDGERSRGVGTPGADGLVVVRVPGARA
jgi:DNA-binding MarR family transcriptional regulator